MRLIDADELMEHVGRERLDSRSLIAQMVQNAPTLTLVRQTAHWEYDENAYDWNLGAWVCSACRGVNANLPVMNGVDEKKVYMFRGSRFCPNCGAAMRRDGDGQTS